MTDDPVAVWRARGETYEAEFVPERYVAQEAALREVLAGLAPASILEVGCGFGRIGAIAVELHPRASYLGVEPSPAMLRSAARRIPNGAFFAGDLRAFAASAAGRRRYDLVITSEVAMHQPPESVWWFVAELRSLTLRWLVTVDWEAPGEVGVGCWGHDYEALLPGAEVIPVGRQAIRVWRPGGGA